MGYFFLPKNLPKDDEKNIEISKSKFLDNFETVKSISDNTEYLTNIERSSTTSKHLKNIKIHFFPFLTNTSPNQAVQVSGNSSFKKKMSKKIF